MGKRWLVDDSDHVTGKEFHRGLNWFVDPPLFSTTMASMDIAEHRIPACARFIGGNA